MDPRACFRLIASLTALGSAAFAQTGGPSIVFIFPPGAQRGQTVEATVAGLDLKEANGVWVSGLGVTGTVTSVQPVVAAKQAKAKKGEETKADPKPWMNPEDAKEAVKISLTIAPDALPGVRDLRLITPSGISTRCRFLVDDLPDRTVTEPNGKPETAVQIDRLPVGINGQIYSGWTGPVGAPDRALFRFRAKAGETIVCDLRGRSLLPYVNQAVPGWLDACLTLYDANGRRLAYADDQAFAPDPSLIFTADKDQEYLLEVRDVLHRSGQEFVYRLRLGAIPFLIDSYPLGGRRGTTTRVALRGANLGRKDLELKLAANTPDPTVVAVTTGGGGSNQRLFAVGEWPESEEKEPNPDTPRATRLGVPATANGRIGEPGDEDVYLFRAEAGQKLLIEVNARRLGSPLDSALQVRDAAGAIVAENDDLGSPQAVPAIAETDTSATVDPRDALLTHQADSRICHTFAQAGEYTVSVRDIREEGGPAFAYRLSVAPAGPDFELRVSPDAARLARGDSVALTATAFRKNGFGGEIRLAAEGLPPGFVASQGIIPAGQDQGVITVSAPADAAPAFICPQIVGTFEEAGQRVVRRAFAVETVVQAFYIKHQVPVQACVMRVEEGGGFTLAAEPPPAQPLEIPQGGGGEVTLNVVRTGTGNAPIALALVPKIPDLTLRPNTIPPGTDSLKVTLSAGKQLPPGDRRSVAVVGTMRDGKSTWTRTTPAISFQIATPAKAPQKPPPQDPAKKP